jgi:hypothetical protein
MIELTPDESAFLASTIRRLSARASRLIDLNQLLALWKQFVIEVESGYSSTGYDYVNDLATRDLLDELVLAAPPSLRDRINHQQLDALDSRFRNASRELATSLSIATPERPKWWWFRIPNDISGQLAMDLSRR